MQALQQRLGYAFDQGHLLVWALTHASFVNEHPSCGPTYERLEFIGDAALDLLAAHLLYTQHPGAAEGDLSRRRAQLVQRDTLAHLAQQLDLSPVIRLGKAYAITGPGASVLADVLEALFGAIFIDGGFDAVQSTFLPLLRRHLAHAAQPQDHKTRLQELAHVRGLEHPVYTVEQVDGSAHAQVFACCVYLGKTVYGRALGTNKKSAEQKCAYKALLVLDQQACPGHSKP